MAGCAIIEPERACPFRAALRACPLRAGSRSGRTLVGTLALRTIYARDRRGQSLGYAGVDAVLVALDVKLVVLAQEF